MLAFGAFLYGASVAYSSMGVATLTRIHDMLQVGQGIILVFGCGFGMGLLAWLKQYMNDPLVNVSCSVASIPIVTVLTKDRATQDGYLSHTSVRQVLFMMIMAILIVTLINLMVLPISGKKDLRENLVKATNAYATMLAGTTSSFLSGSEDDTKHPAMSAASDKFKDAYSALDQNLIDGRKEHYVRGTEKRYWIEKRLVSAMQRLSQDIGGLRSALSIQFWLLAEGAKKGGQTPNISSKSQQQEPATAVKGDPPVVIRDFAPWSGLGSVFEESDASSTDTTYRPLDADHKDFSLLKPDGPSAATAGHIFATFIEELGPPMVCAQ